MRAFDFCLCVVELVFEAEFCFGVCEVFYAAVYVAFSGRGVELVVESEIEAGVLFFCYDASGCFFGSLVASWVVDRALAHYPGGIEDLVVGCAFEVIERFAVEEELESLGDFLFRHGVGLCGRSRFGPCDCAACDGDERGEDEGCGGKVGLDLFHGLCSFFG